MLERSWLDRWTGLLRDRKLAASMARSYRMKGLTTALTALAQNCCRKAVPAEGQITVIRVLASLFKLITDIHEIKNQRNPAVFNTDPNPEADSQKMQGSHLRQKTAFFTQKKSRLHKSENAVRLLYAKNSDLTHQNAFSLFVFCTHQRRFVERLPWV